MSEVPVKDGQRLNVPSEAATTERTTRSIEFVSGCSRRTIAFGMELGGVELSTTLPVIGFPLSDTSAARRVGLKWNRRLLSPTTEAQALKSMSMLAV